ncbi:hypothetical protein P7C73_g4080, partial [Tremellales sp. Uapishka_1]
MRLLSVLALVSSALLVAAKSGFGEACAQSNTHLDSNTWALIDDCDPTTYCADNQTCAYKGCRNDIYPFGYSDYDFNQLPPLCPQGQFCPDEGDACLNQAPVGGSCQKDRDNECAPASNYKDLSGYLNSNGSTCLNYICYYNNVTVGQTCVFENTVYTAYTDSGSEYAYIVSRDNCANGLYCDGSSMQCIKDKTFGTACSGNKECLSYNCNNGKCGRAADQPVHAGNYVYALVGLGIVALIGGVMVALWFTHRRSRAENQIKLEQYYNEQIAYRQSIMSMSHAKNSLLSLPANTTADVARQTLYRDDAYSDSLLPPSALPPNIRRDSSAQWSEGADSEVLLMGENRRHQRI